MTWDPSITIGNADLTITQTAYSDAYPTLRYHKVTISWVKENGTYINTTNLVNNTETTTVTYNAANDFKAVIINADGQDFVRCILDNDSLTFFKTNISKITGGGVAAAGLRRMMTWNHINEMVRDQMIKVSDLKDIVLNNLATETDDSIYDF